MINPGSKDYKSLYVHDSTYYRLSSGIHPIVEVDIAESVMKSDRSLMPFTRN
jgi:hypothetical protein